MNDSLVRIPRLIWEFHINLVHLILLNVDFVLISNYNDIVNIYAL